MQLENAFFIISIDVDVGSRELGMLNRGKNDANISRYMSEYEVGQIEEATLRILVSAFNEIEAPVTFAIRGQLADVDCSILELLLKSSVKHDIGAHGYYHRQFTNLSRIEAEKEFDLISTGMKKAGIIPRSFVFPCNRVAHLDLLEKYGYKCYRGRGGFRYDSMCIEKQGELYKIHPSLCFDNSINSIFLKKIVDIAVKKKLPFHIWFHPWKLVEANNSKQNSIKKMLFPLLSYAKKKEKSGELTFETMVSAAERVENLSS